MERGYTGHEHLQGVELIHMNGRLYDPLLHRFLAPDNYVQDPYNTQNFNRYGYVYNNPLMYTDVTGEWFGIDDAIAFVIGGTVNLVVNAIQGNIDSWADGFAAFGAGGAAGTLALYGPAGWVAGGAILGGTNAYLANGNVGMGILTGAVSGLAGGAAGQWAAKSLGSVVINGTNIASPVLKGAVTGTIGGGAGSYAGGFTSGLITTGDIGQAHQMGMKGLTSGLALGGIIGGASGYAYAKANKIDLWNGRPLETNTTKYTFGFRDEAIRLADELGGSHLMKDSNWKDSFIKIINDPKSEIHFSLKGTDQTPMNMINSPSRSSTNWEMYQLYQSPAFERTIFYYGTKTYIGYDVFQIKL